METLFGCRKRRGFNFEDTHLTDPQRLSNSWAYSPWPSPGPTAPANASMTALAPSAKKTLGRPLKSLFRHGLDFLRRIALNLTEKFQEFLWALEVLSCT